MKERANIKNKICILLFLVFSFSIVFLFGGVGCGGQNGGGTTDRETIPAEFSINYNSIEIKQFESVQLMVEYNVIPNVQLVFSSSDSKIASVSNEGKVYGEGIGKTTIDVVYGNQKASCEVTVTQDTFMPHFQFSNLPMDKELTVRETEDINLEGIISYNKNTFTDFEVEYVYDESLGIINNNVYTSNVLGTGVEEQTTEITVVAKWRGITVENAPSLTKTIKIKIVKRAEIENDRILINDTSCYPDNIILYTTHEVEGYTFPTSYDFVCRTEKDGVVSSDDSNLTISINGDCIEKIGEKLIVAKEGNAIVTVDYNKPTTSVEELTSVSINVEVRYPKLTKPKLEKQSTLDGITLPVTGKQINKIVQLNKNEVTELSFIGNKNEGFTITDLQVLDNKMTETAIEVYFDKYAYVYEVQACAKVIRTEADLAVIKPTETNKLVNGYYLLDNDLVVNSKWEAISETNFSYSRKTVGFNGVFDGAGHKLTVKELGNNGVFGVLAENAVVKNTHIVIESIKSTAPGRCNALAFTMLANATVNDIVIEVVPTQENKIENFNGVCYSIIYIAPFTNSVVVVNENVTLAIGQDVRNDMVEEAYGGLLMTLDAGYITSCINNVVVISPTERLLGAYKFQGHTNYASYAKNDTKSWEESTYKANGYELRVGTNINIYASVKDAVENKVSAVGSWIVSEEGFIFEE